MSGARTHQAALTPASAPPDEPVADVQRYYQAIAPLYEAELSEQGDHGFWRALGREPGVQRVLELGSGTGRVTEALAAGGAHVIGMDAAPSMVARAQQRLGAHPHVSFVLADMRRFWLRAPFDLIVAADDPFSHLTLDADRAQALHLVAQHLASDGRFVLDALWFPAAEQRQLRQPGGRVRTRSVRLRGRLMHVRERWRHDRVPRLCRALYEYCVPGAISSRAAFTARYWTVADLEDDFNRAGLMIEKRWGSFDGAPWVPDTAERLIVQARRR